MAEIDQEVDPAERGRLTIRHRAVEHITVAAALNTPGVRRHGSGLGRLAGRELPRVDVDVAGDRVRADVEVAVEWGRSLAATATAVRRDVTRALSDHSGLTVDGVRVHIAAVIPPDTTSTRSLE
ncbi:Asp23/Gls24 family envelope stress response protein [Mycolicibacterium arenosum]|uniref:Asp23/Gls24 family envelope stress response protein n=1 Tax=Mycolicibacterium arenosum TaxID=2952157 RepID=A0ABT1LYW7_9MYCO|nr:Asp23/Gls24 family envelope stress response protein [Mycolicibacterium sp. CAU 1645]MCP9271717.1 Asp23/Gls24 family envelope stress response protein [Mycolicibacterium sp. CAU 1645]